MGEEWIKYTVRSELGIVEDSARGLRAGCPGQDMHLTQRLVSACPRVFTCLLTLNRPGLNVCIHAALMSKHTKWDPT